jgi:hypothetical protein
VTTGNGGGHGRTLIRWPPDIDILNRRRNPPHGQVHKDG